MKTFKKHRNTVGLIALVLAMLLFNACGKSNEKSTSPATGPSQAAVAAGLSTCTTCHTSITTDWLKSKHANAVDGDLNSPGSPTMSEVQANASCAPCHDPNGDSAALHPNYTGNVPRPVVGCEACHGPGSEHVAAGGVGSIGFANTTAGVIGTTSAVEVSAQFLTCTACHELLSKTDPANTSATAAHDAGGTDPRVIAMGANANSNSITDTHFAVAKASGTIAGYAMDFSSETVCTDCHNPHKNADINRQWAMSAKADKSSGGVWATRNWSTQPFCQRCHTTSGFVALSNAMKAGNADLVNQIIRGTLSTSPVPSTATWKPEMLLCTACHTDNKGTVRNPGAFTADYSYTFYSFAPINYSVASHAYPDAGNSNVCMPCHTGRQGGDSIKNMNIGAVTAWDFSNITVLGNHNMQAGGMMFRGAGYNYTNRDYSNPPQFMHDKIGTPDSVPATGTNGPCVICHMTSPGGTSNHLFPLPVNSSTTTTVNGIARSVITSVPFGICATCHGSNPTALLDLASKSESNYLDAQAALAKAMESVGIYRRGTSFYRARDAQLISAGAVTISTGGTVVLGYKTNWSAVGLEAGDKFRIDNDTTGTWYSIASVDTPTQLTLSTAFTGTNYSLVNYRIQKNETVTVANGSKTVTGGGTNWISTSGTITAGDYIRIDNDGTWNKIASVNSDTQLTLSANYAGLSTTTAEFSLRNNAKATVGGATVTITNANLITLDVGVPFTTSATSTTPNQFDYFRVDNDATGTWYQISDRTANTLTLTTAYTGSAATNAAFTIIRNVANRKWLVRGDVDTSGNTTGKDTMGAAFNLNSLANSNNDPGAYIHNPFYARKLIYDSIDWVDDGVMNYSTGATLNSLCTGASAPPWCAGAMSYLLPIGVAGGGVSAERP